MGYIRSMTLTVSSLITHEDYLTEKVVRPKDGLRVPDNAFYDKKGHYIEINLALYGALKRGLPGLETKFMIGKNPKHCLEPQDIDQIGMHMMLYFKLNNHQNLADSVSGEVYRYPGEKYFHSNILLSKREFASFFLVDTAEEVSYHQENYNDALIAINLVLGVDPNNYIAYLQTDEIRICQGLHESAEKAFNLAIEIAPDLIDTWKVYGDYLYETYVSTGFAKEIYREAIERDTDDYQVVKSLEKTFSMLKMNAEKNSNKKI